MINSLHPGLLLIVVALLLPIFKSKMRSLVLLISPLLSLWLIWLLPDGNSISISFLEQELQPLHSDKLSRIFSTVFSIMLFTGALYSYKQANIKELSAAFVYGGSAIGATMAGDLISLFVFWEIMALASTVILWLGNQDSSESAGMRYLLMHLFGGVVLMTGIVFHVIEFNSIEFSEMNLESLSSWLILSGFLLNAGAPPLSAWLADAYPEASFGGMVFLSAFTTKTAVYVLMRGFPGAELLIFVGLYMIFYGIIYALLENDMRKILAYSIINQVGFMVCGIGIGTEMALNGTAAHAFTHIIYKALLLMSAGAVLYQTGKRKCSELGGLFQSMPITMWCGIVGALSISAFPLTSGFVSKSMVTQSAVDENLLWIWLLLQAASAGVFLHAGIKFPWFVFFQKDSGLRPDDPPVNMRVAMIFFAVLCIAIGIFPNQLYELLPYSVNYKPYTGAHVLAQLQLLLFSGLAFFILLPWMKRTLTISLDFDWFYRHLFKQFLYNIESFLCRMVSFLEQSIAGLYPYFIKFYHRRLLTDVDGEIGFSVLLVLVLLSFCLSLVLL